MQQIGELKVEAYMSPRAIVVAEGAAVEEAIDLMERYDLSVLPVVDESETVVGILSITDLFRVTHEFNTDLAIMTHASRFTRQALVQTIQREDTMQVSEIMTTPVATISAKMNMVVAAQKLLDLGVHHLPVVDDQGKPLGVLSTSDFVRIVADFGPKLAG